jgi:hypothetical protein
MTMGEALWLLAVIWSAAAWATALTLLARWVIRHAR